jgi:putative endonuclease
MSYVVYVLFSKKDKRLYVGCTANLEKRIQAHNTGKVIATRHRRPLVVIYSEEFDSKAEAFNRERFLKSLWAGRFKRKLVLEYLRRNSQISQS